MSQAFEALRGCFWPVASAAPTEMAAARAAANGHRDGAIRLATCQRIEVYAIDPCACGAPAGANGVAALRHLAEVAAGLHAAVLGETQVLGQVREAVARADTKLRQLGDVAIAAARELRREAAFHADTSENLDRALSYAGMEARGTLLILGAGHMGKTLARRAGAMGFEHVIVAARHAAGRELPPGAHELVDLEHLGSLGSVAVAVGCLGDRYGAAHLRELPAADLYVDLGTPANFAASLPNRVTIADLVDHEPEAARARREQLRERLAELLDRRICDARETSATPAGRLRREIEAIRRREARAIEKLHPEIPGEIVDAITRRLVNQIFHLPSARLKAHEDAEFSDRVADLFAQSPEYSR
jgi:glutamyl-tRNA reductase